MEKPKTTQEMVYEEYIKNKYKKMWENQKEKGDEIYSLASLAPDIKDLALKMERIRDGNPFTTCDSSKLSKEEFEKASKVAEMALVITEVWEAIEAILTNKNPDTEYADINIRTMNAMTRNTGSDMNRVILAKHLKNLKRGETHGRTV